jgi:nucleoside 2-deoxyribosyltransferase
VKKLRVYITGPQQYYPNGWEELKMMQAVAERYGFVVANDFSAPPGEHSRRPGQRQICQRQTCREFLDDCDIVIADVNFFRGGEPEGGTIFDLGVGFAKKKRLYSFTRDRRDVIHRYPHATYNEKGGLLDLQGWNFNTALSVGNLMYTIPSKVVEGGFEDCLKTVVMDLIEEEKDRGQRVLPRQDQRDQVTWPPENIARAYLAGFECFLPNAREVGDSMKKICEEYHFQGIFPADDAPGAIQLDDEAKKDVYVLLANIFDRDQQHIRNSNMIIANLNPYHGQEPDSGTAFEVGMCYGLGYDCYTFISDGRPLIERVHCRKGDDGIYRDVEGYRVEDYGFPLARVFHDCGEVIIGDFADAAKRAAIDIGKRVYTNAT